MRKMKTILVTGGYGFIGTNFIKFMFEEIKFSGRIINLDSITYAGNPFNLKDIEEKYNAEYIAVNASINDLEILEEIFTKYEIDTIVHFAAESHVDRSINGPAEFIRTNILGTFSLLETARNCWKTYENKLFHHISTDEVYGSLGKEGLFKETTPYDPRSPYSASKASSDHLVKAYFHTYGLPVTISNCSNNYGPYQFPEKVIPLMITNLLNKKPLPVYGDGTNIRDWLHVKDHCSAIYKIITEGKTGETYNIGGEHEESNINLIHQLCHAMASIKDNDEEEYLKLITFVKDRQGHDKRYAIDCSKIKTELGWNSSISFENGINETIRWYIKNQDWLNNIINGNYKNWIKLNYEKR